MAARKYSGSSKDNYDIFLPNWLTRHNKTIYTAIVIVVVIIILYQLFKKAS